MYINMFGTLVVPKSPKIGLYRLIVLNKIAKIMSALKMICMITC